MNTNSGLKIEFTLSPFRGLGCRLQLRG